MRQIQLMQTVNSLKNGQAINISRSDMVEATEGSLPLLLFDSVRPSDVSEFIKTINENWGVEVTENHINGSFTMRKYA